MQINTALDLPSLSEMNKQITFFKIMKFLIPKDQKDELLKLEVNFQSLVNTIDRFYETLGEKNWIFHDSLNVEKVNKIIFSNEKNLEEQFISLYANAEDLTFFISRLNTLSEFKVRNDLILKAKDDYLSGRYYSTVFILLSVIDGFVNDFEKKHKGFHARNSDEFGSLDSVVAHHKGISRIHKIYTKSFSVTVSEPIYDLYRNGIMHGVTLNFDNIIVATKAWNLLFSIRDWAVVKLKETTPIKKEKSWREIFSQISENEKAKKELKSWQPSLLKNNEHDFEKDTAFVACDLFLSLWLKKNYGEMSKFLMHSVKESQGNSAPKFLREIYDDFKLEKYKILSINHLAPAICKIECNIKIANNDSLVKTFRWVFEDSNGQPTISNGHKAGNWKLVWGYR